jgi:hypothetical protein
MSIEQVLAQVVEQRCAARATELLPECIDLLDVVSPGARAALTESFTVVALRALEARLLADPELRTLALFWRANAARADETIARRVEALCGAPPSDSLRRHLRSCIRSRSSREGQHEGIPSDIVRDTLADLLNMTSGRAVRCQSCGYHFLSDDLGADRRSLIEDLSPNYATSRHPRRLVDTLKPWQLNGRSLTQLTIDHVTPEAGLGWTGAGNHAVLCHLCNHAKAIYRSPVEPVSTVVAASLQACPAERAHSFPRQLAMWAIIATVGRCSTCARGATATELTVVLPDENQALRWLVPWVSEVVCYECLVNRAGS